MAWETIGSIDTGDLPEDREWIEFCLDLAIRYIRAVCGEPPPGCDLAVMWNDQELGEYPIIGVYSEVDAPSEYAVSCESALSTFDNAVDWDALKDEYDRAREEDEQT